MEETRMFINGINPSKSKPHIPSKVQADTLFTFTKHLDFLLPTIKNRMISPRYCDEDIKYLKIQGLKKVAFPMKCFCDINLHKLEEHLSWYGYYGLAFSKEWGMNNKIQPIQYINPNSELCKDFSLAISSALNSKNKIQSNAEKKMKNYLLHQLMYFKPYSGKFKNRNTQKEKEKCFTDECEWRFIPDVTTAGYQQIYYDKHIINEGDLLALSNSLEGNLSVSLPFEYSDIKYIIVKTESDFHSLTSVIDELNLDVGEKYEIISKIVVWDNAKGDF